MAARRSRKPESTTSAAPVRQDRSATAYARSSGVGVAPLVAAGLVVALACGAYANSLRNAFVWDDQIILSRQLVVFDSLRTVLVTPRDIPQYSPDYYRPVTVASFLLDRALGGNDPLVYHLSVVLAHTGVSLLVLALGWMLFPGKSGSIAATVAAALFAVHPIHTESVAWIAGRSDVLATLFLLAALVAHLRLPRGWLRVATVGTNALLALGAKETAISVVPILVLCDLLVTRRGEAEPRGIWWPGHVGVGLASVLYLALRRAAVGSVVGDAATGDTVERSLADLVGAVGSYWMKLVWPTSLNAYIDAVPSDDLTLGATMVASLVLAALAVRTWRDGRGTATFLFLWLGLTLTPSLAIVWKIPEAPMAERYLYLPSVAFCLLAGYAVLLLWERAGTAVARGAVIGAVCLVVLAAAMVTWARNRVWRDDLALWSDTAAKSQIAGLPMRSLGVAHLQRGHPEEARRYLEQALQRRNGPNGLQVIYNNLGTLAMRTQRYDEAQRHYEAALQAYPNAADTLFNLGLAILQGRGGGRDAATAALEYFQRAEQLSPHDADIQAALGQVAAIRGDRERAIAYLRRALELGPSPQVADNIRSYLEKL